MSVQFGPFRLDAENACIWQGSEALHLTPKAFAVLRALLARPGRLVTKDELWQSVWPGIAVSDAALTVCIREIRQRLHDNAKELWPEVGDGLTDKAAYRGGVQRLHFSNEGGIRRVRQ